MNDPLTGVERKKILAASSPWLGALLNLLPGIGSGYIYQRRWRCYWITSMVAVAWFAAGAVLGREAFLAEDLATDARQQLVGLAGLVLLAVVTALEAFLAGRRARMD